MIYGYKWTVDGYDVETPEQDANPQPQFLDIPRGCVAGNAQFYLRTSDAKIVLAKSSVSIICKVYTRLEDGSDDWANTTTLEWKEYIPFSIEEDDQTGFSLLVLKDKRHKLDRVEIAKIWNQVRYVTFPTSGTETITYEPLYLNGGATYSYQDIVTEILGYGSLTAPALPSGGSNVPNNLQCTGSPAVFLDGVLASLGFAMTLQRDGTIGYVDVSDMTLSKTITDARTDRRIAMTFSDNVLHGKVTIWPVKYYPYHPKSSSETFGSASDVEEVIILDHELADKNAGVVSARKTAIKTVVESWHKAERSEFDDTFYGMLDVVPGTGIVQVTWYIDAPHVGGPATRVQNYSPPMPWPERTEPPPPTPLWGKTAAAIAADSTGEVYVDNPITSSPYWSTSGKLQIVYVRGTAIAINKRVMLFPIDDRWCAVEVC